MATYDRLSKLTVQLRNDALYYDEVNDLLPTDQPEIGLVSALLPLVHQFAREVWWEIR